MNALAPQSVRGFIEHLSLSSRFAASRISRQFRAKVPLFIETSRYQIKTATDLREIEEVLRLRHEIFFEELQNRKKAFGIELDSFDLSCDHLMIIDRSSYEIVGTYRLICSEFTDRFYSEGEFDLSLFKTQEGTKLELGRLCIKREHRNGIVMQLLWRGVTQYMKSVDARYLLGCSSVQVTQAQDIAAATSYLTSIDALDDQYLIRPRLKYSPPESPFPPNSENRADETLLPPLLFSYLRAGAKFSPVPALDLDFGCTDFLTILDRTRLSPLFARRYFE